MSASNGKAFGEKVFQGCLKIESQFPLSTLSVSLLQEDTSSFQQADRSSCHSLYLYGVGCEMSATGNTTQMSVDHDEFLRACTPGASLRKGRGNSSMVGNSLCDSPVSSSLLFLSEWMLVNFD